MAFINRRLPVDVAFGTAGGPEWRTEIARLGSGFEQRNQVWANPRLRANAGYALRKLSEQSDIDTVTQAMNIYKILEFHHMTRGRLHSFKARMLWDYKSCGPLQDVTPFDQEVGTTEAGTTEMQLVKSYGLTNVYTREMKLVYNVRLARDGVELTEGTHFTVAGQTGKITFLNPQGAGREITAGFWFDEPVRFDTDHLVIDLAAWESGVIPDVPLVGIRLQDADEVIE